MNKTSIFRTGLWIFAVALMLGGCSTKPVQVGEGEIIEPVYPAERMLKDDVEYVNEIYDPWSGFNRTIYRFNYNQSSW